VLDSLGHEAHTKRITGCSDGSRRRWLRDQ